MKVILPAARLDLVRADVLRDASLFAGDDVALPDGVEERRLAVIDVPHDRHDGGAPLQALRLPLALLAEDLVPVALGELDLEAVVVGDHDDRVGVQPLVDRHHEPEPEALLDDLGRVDLELLGDLGDRRELGEMNDVLFLDDGDHFLAVLAPAGLPRDVELRERALHALLDRLLVGLLALLGLLLLAGARAARGRLRRAFPSCLLPSS